MALPLVDAARHNDVKPLMGRELMILTHDDDDDDDDVCMCVDSWSQQGARICNEDTRFAFTTSIPHCNNDSRPSQ